jgi:RNA polymerase sigma-70 factor, ECF subfamily
MEIESSEPGPRKGAFELLVKSNMKRAYFAALGILGSHDAAMEISQEAFVRAFKHFDTFDLNRNFFTWYYKILRNLCLNYIRDNKNRLEENFIEEKEYKSEEDFSESYERREMSLLLETALRQLKNEEREIIILKEFEGYSYKEISGMLEIPIGSVMSKLFYARKKLADKMKRLTA